MKPAYWRNILQLALRLKLRHKLSPLREPCPTVACVIIPYDDDIPNDDELCLTISQLDLNSCPSTFRTSSEQCKRKFRIVLVCKRKYLRFFLNIRQISYTQSQESNPRQYKKLVCTLTPPHSLWQPWIPMWNHSTMEVIKKKCIHSCTISLHVPLSGTPVLQGTTQYKKIIGHESF